MFKSTQIELRETVELNPEQFTMTTFGFLGPNRHIEPDVTDPWWLAGKSLVGKTNARMDKTQPIVITRIQAQWHGFKLGKPHFVVSQGENVEVMWEGVPTDFVDHIITENGATIAANYA